jgi:hypothetical protein
LADQKISELTALTGANVADDDAIAIVDTSATETKKIVFSELKNALDTATGFVRITGDTMTGNLSMGDNVKAIFGAGSDLQIYHDGQHSYIDEQGTGSLQLRATNLNIKSATNETYIACVADGQVELNYDNATKLATTSTGIDVKNVASGANAKLNITTESTGGGTSEILFSDNTTGRGRIYYDHGSSPEELHIETTGTDAIVIDNSQNVTMPNGNLDVTGTVTADGLTVNGASDPTIRLYNTGTVGLGELLGTVEFYQEDGSSPGAGVVASIEARNTDPASGAGSLVFTAGLSNSNNDRMLINSNGDISFYEDTGTTAKFFWDASAESLGIGTSLPSNSVSGLHVSTASSTDQLYLERTGSATAKWYLGAAANSLYFHDTVAASTRMIIDSSGNVGIGATSISGVLTLQKNQPASSTAGTGTTLTLNGDANAGNPWEIFRDNGVTGDLVFSQDASGTRSEYMRIDSSGRVGIGGVPNTNWRNDIADQEVLMLGTEATFFADSGVTTELWNNAYVDNDDVFKNISTRGASRYFQYEGAHKWFTAASASAGSNIGTEINTTPKMTLDVSGNLLVGTTTTVPGVGNTTAGVSIRGDDGSFFSRSLGSGDTNNVVTINRSSDDGNILGFNKDGATVGSIGTAGGDIIVGTGTSRLNFYDATPAILPSSSETFGASDGAIDLGNDGRRFKDLYLSGDVITGGGGTGNTGEIQFKADSTRARIVGGYDSGGGGYIAFRTDTTGGTDLERARFNNAGNLAFTSGNGIDFSATSGTGTSELLDDYEEGTWTPSFGNTGGVTYDQQSGRYTKIGRAVHIQGVIRWSAFTPSSNVFLGGLPFTPEGSDHFINSVSVFPANGTAYNVAYEYLSGGDLFFYNNSGSLGGSATSNPFGSSGGIIINGIYYA